MPSAGIGLKIGPGASESGATTGEPTAVPIVGAQPRTADGAKPLASQRAEAVAEDVMTCTSLVRR